VKAQKQVTRQAIVMVIGFLIGWTPYAIVCLYVTIGKVNVFGPKGAMLPAMLAKSSFCYNPFIYVGMNKQVSDYGNLVI
jgi:c-opsin